MSMINKWWHKGGVKRSGKTSDVIYGWPLNENKYFFSACGKSWVMWNSSIISWAVLCQSLSRPDKVPFIYYLSTFIAKNLIWLPKLSPKLFFCEFFFSTLHLDEIFMLLYLEIFSNKEEKCSRNSWKRWGSYKKCLRNIWMAPKFAKCKINLHWGWYLQ